MIQKHSDARQNLLNHMIKNTELCTISNIYPQVNECPPFIPTSFMTTCVNFYFFTWLCCFIVSSSFSMLACNIENSFFISSSLSVQQKHLLNCSLADNLILWKKIYDTSSFLT